MSDTKPQSQKMTRRSFLKVAATTTAVAAVGDHLFGGPLSILVKNGKAKAAAPKEDKWVPTHCNLCDQNCGIRIHVVDGVVTNVEGEPSDPRNHGKICGRPNTYAMYLYNPWRVKAPMKRTNPQKGLGVDPKWEEITWDEALDTVGEKLKAAREKDKHSLWWHTGHREVGDLSADFSRVYGTVNRLGSVNFCTGGANHMHKLYYVGSGDAQLMMDVNKLIIEVGGRFYGAKGGPEVTRYSVRLRENGCKFLYVAPMIAPSNPYPDEWLPIKPGTDAALGLAMCNVMVHELGQKYPGFDVEFFKKRTNAPYLIRPDGQYMRAEGSDDPKLPDKTRLEIEFGKPLVWDAVDNKPKVFDDPTVQDFALEGTYQVKWKDMEEVECKTAFELFKEHLNQYTPEKAAEITGIPAETVRRITKEFVDAASIGSTIVLGGTELRYRPAAYAYSKSLSGSRGWHTQSACKLPNVMIGNLNVPGGWGAEDSDLTKNEVDGCTLLHEYFYEGITYPSEHASYAMDSRTAAELGRQGLYPIMYNFNTIAWYALNDPKKYALQHPPEVYFFNGCNILGDSFSPEFVAEQMAKIPFIFGVPYHFDDVANMADVLLPPDSYIDGDLKMLEIGAYCQTEPPVTRGPMLMHGVVPRIYNTKNVDDILIELADRTGLLKGEKGLNARINRSLKGQDGKYKLDTEQKYTYEEIVDRKYKADFGDDLGIDWFKKNGWLVESVGDPIDLYADQKFPDTRYRLYIEDFVWLKEQYRQDLEKIKAEHGVELRPSNQFVLDYYRPFPDFIPRPYEELPAEYDMYAVHYKTMLHSMTTFMDNAWVAEYMQNFDPYTMNIMINPEAAEKRGIQSGDVIWVESPFGKVKTECVVTELIRPDTVAIAGCFGATSPGLHPSAREGALFNRLCWADENWRDPITGNQENGMKVKVYKA